VVLSLGEGNATTRFHQRHCWFGSPLAARRTGRATPAGATLAAIVPSAGNISQTTNLEREELMLYLVEAHPTVERANVVDAGEGPGPVIGKIVERFRPQAIYGNPSRRQVFMVVDLDTPAKMAELMYVLAWFVDVEPTFTPLMSPEIYGEAIAKAKQIITPQKSAS
jgi:hypothetical protein